ncbi:RNA-directed RNA polymerase [ssRNA phage Gephyllon.4_15]|uniref:RNA-directed RNA polymerase n=2 Tax=Fiersviridae TaxID=2842319 RepID=A0A8S5L1Z9_9VIRU|nr:RNA-directed RNA polymerase [ssRNA phage Gephyllon.4_15]QDH87149.1 MAG: RNA-dependent RNA polymerase [Leviviridae sp.]DAD51507.1 TPA_asm: RNA-directed RNA polymerase [ssRNA phage Gephyllon.4_15]
MTEVTLPSDVTRQASLYYEGLGTPVALAAAVMLRSGCWDGLAALSVKPSSYNDSLSYFRDASAAALLKKLQQLPGSAADRRMRTIRKWWEGERACLLTNHRLSAYMPENLVFDLPRHAGISTIIAEIRKTILDWIGPQPPELALGRFGPGATFSDRGGKTTVPDKMSSDPTLTRDAVWYLPQWLGTAWGADLAQRGGELSFVEGNRFATVPKTALIDRSIASEPSINGFYQLALGRALRSKLRKRTGWDLDCAQTIHRRVAGISSVTRELATLDLSNASDTVSKELVRLLLPRRWFDELDHLRSKKTLIDRKWVVLEKFSSMGNGYTFELETIIFAAITTVMTRLTGNGKGVLGRDTFVFGDDIICMDGVVSELVAALRFFGFTINEEKSFHGSSPFRESCGADFFNGDDVRPFFLKDLPEGPGGYIAFANGLRAVEERLGKLSFTLPKSAWFAILDQIPASVRNCRGPKDLGDIVIHDDESRWKTRWQDGIRHVRAFIPWKTSIVNFGHFTPSIVLACATYGTGGGIRGGLSPRGADVAYKVSWVPAS